MSIAQLGSLFTFCVLFSFMPRMGELRAQDRACIRPRAQTQLPGYSVVLRKTSGFPCKIQLVDKGITLQADADGVVADIQSVIRAADGRFFSSTMSGEVSVWSPGGKFQLNLGRVGKGPGEFARGPKFLMLDNRGRLMVGDNNLRLSVFGIDNKFEISFPAASLGTGTRGCCAVLDDGTFLTAYWGSDISFRIHDLSQRNTATPPVIRAFGPKTKSRSDWRRIAYAGGNTFWAGPTGGNENRYELEEWRTDGTLVGTLRREVPWVPVGADPTGVDEPEFVVLHMDRSGLLYAGICIKGPSAAALSKADKSSRAPNGALDKAFDCYLEVIDTKSHIVLASTGPLSPSQANKQFPTGFFRETNEGYQYRENADGLPSAHVVAVKLVRQ